VYQAYGCCYRLNARLQADTVFTADDPTNNLCGKKLSWVQSPARFIMFHEPDGYAYQGLFVHWHGASRTALKIDASDLWKDPDPFVAPTLFVDGHAQTCNFTSAFKNNPSLPLEDGKDWIWYQRLR
jgi:hypothetical protein